MSEEIITMRERLSVDILAQPGHVNGTTTPVEPMVEQHREIVPKGGSYALSLIEVAGL